MRQYGYEDQVAIEKELRRFKKEIFGETKIGAYMASIKIFANGDIEGEFLIDEDGSSFRMAITRDGNRVEKQHLDGDECPFHGFGRE